MHYLIFTDVDLTDTDGRPLEFRAAYATKDEAVVQAKHDLSKSPEYGTRVSQRNVLRIEDAKGKTVWKP